MGNRPLRGLYLQRKARHKKKNVNVAHSRPTRDLNPRVPSVRDAQGRNILER
jgi:hypothetical protein